MKKNHSITIIFLIIFLLTGCTKKSIIGKWKSVDTKNDYYFIFNKDKTCSYEMAAAKLNCTYEINEDQLIILYDGNTTKSKFKYRFDGKILIIKDENNKYNEFTKEKTK